MSRRGDAERYGGTSESESPPSNSESEPDMDIDIDEHLKLRRAGKKPRLSMSHTQDQSGKKSFDPASSSSRTVHGRRSAEQVIHFLGDNNGKGTSTHPGVTPLGRCSDKGKGRQSMRKSTLAPLSHSAPVARNKHSTAKTKHVSRSSASGHCSQSSSNTPNHSDYTTPPSVGQIRKQLPHSSANTISEDIDPPSDTNDDDGAPFLGTEKRPSNTSESDFDSRRVLMDMHNMLHCLIRRVEGTEKELKSIKVRMSTPSSDSSSSNHKQKVPVAVKSETRKIYQLLINDAEDFEGYDIGPEYTFKDDRNQAVTQMLVKEVRAQNHKFQACDIRSAAYTYYKTLTQQESLERRGKLSERNKKRRRRERVLRKLQERHSAFQKREYSGRDKQKWKEIIISELMSSEESDEENENNMIVRPLPWRSPLVDDYFQSLDEQIASSRSSQSIRQTKQRGLGLPSTRPQPSSIPVWACIN